MKPTLKEWRRAFTRVELIVVIYTVVILSAVLLPARTRRLPDNRRLRCMNNLKQVGMAYRVWSGDHGNFPPPQQTAALGGWKDLLKKPDQGAMCWSNFAIMRDELGQLPKMLACPSDEREPSTNFTTDFKDNTHVSCFVGVGASEVYPQSMQGGDRNLGPGSIPDPDFGYSPTNGKGNDVAISIAGPLSWSLKMHSAGKTAGAGIVLLGDGSAQQVTTASLNKFWLRNALDSGNLPAGHVPAVPSIRLVFP